MACKGAWGVTGEAVGAEPGALRRFREGGGEALAMPACIAPIANKEMVGASPGVLPALGAGGVVVSFALCSPSVAARVHRQPVVAAAETGSGGTVLQWDGRVGKVSLASGGECRADGSIVCTLRHGQVGGVRLVAGGVRVVTKKLLPCGGPVGGRGFTGGVGGERGKTGCGECGQPARGKLPLQAAQARGIVAALQEQGFLKCMFWLGGRLAGALVGCKSWRRAVASGWKGGCGHILRTQQHRRWCGACQRCA